MQTGVIVRVLGSGAFRKRIIEMGFVPGTAVRAIKKAPLQDPVEYELMGYRVSLRHNEAQQIEITQQSPSEGEQQSENHAEASLVEHERAAGQKTTGKTIRVALVGNPNSGKTTLFNRATGKHERVGNYGGVTVDVKTAHLRHGDYRIELTDLPGTYSISEYSPEERFVRRHLTETPPDIVINVVDASNLERNLFLTTQLMEMDLRVIVALNIYDELARRGDRFEYEHLSEMIGIPMLPTVAAKGKGIGTLLDRVIEEYENPSSRQVRIDYGQEGPSETARYGFIHGALKETYHPASAKPEPKGYRPDRILTDRWLGIPIFLLLMWAMFQITFTLGAYPMEWIETGVGALGEWVSGTMAEGMLKDLLVDGVIGGVGGVIVFLPNILILFFCISLMEDTGYMARAAFMMDKVMHKIGLHGKSFIPMLMGFGCGVPAIMATRTLDNRKDRILTMLCIPFMSCSARLPVYILLVSAFFPANQGLVLLSIYLIGIALAAITAVILGKTLFRKADVPFVMELPPYRTPTLRNIGRHTWNKSVQYLTKMGTVILVASVVVWALGYFPHSEVTLPEDATQEQVIAAESEQMEHSFIGQLGRAIEPAIEPLGYDWKIGVSILTGVAAKEIVVSSMGVLYRSELQADETSAGLQTQLRQQTFGSGPHVGQRVFTPLVAYSFMVFVLIYFPCFAALSAIRREAGIRWALFTAFYTTGLAWLVSFLIYRIGGLF